jgi:putative tricarboxylic transport membrane protein
MPRLSMDAVYGGVLLLVGALLMLSTFDPRYQGFGIGSDVSPMFFPRILLCLWLTLATVILVRGLRAPGGDWPPQMKARAAGVIVTVLASTFAMTIVGFLFAMIPCFMIVSLLLGYRRPLPILAFGLLVPILTWFVFTALLEVFLPTSPWFDLI